MDRYRFIDGIGVYFVTFTVVDWLPVFIEEEPVNIFFQSMRFCIEKKNLRTYAYVVMPNHVHAVLFDSSLNETALHTTLSDLRKFTGRQLADYIHRRYSQPISRILQKQDLVDRSRRFWSSGWHAQGLFSEGVLQQKVDYIHLNPCRKGFVNEPQHWKWSSAAYWSDGKQVDLPIADVFWE